MKQRLIALAEDKVLTQKEKERVITTARLGIVCVAYYALNARERGAYISGLGGPTASAFARG